MFAFFDKIAYVSVGEFFSDAGFPVTDEAPHSVLEEGGRGGKAGELFIFGTGPAVLRCGCHTYKAGRN